MKTLSHGLVMGAEGLVQRNPQISQIVHISHDFIEPSCSYREIAYNPAYTIWSSLSHTKLTQDSQDQACLDKCSPQIPTLAVLLNNYSEAA